MTGRKGALQRRAHGVACAEAVWDRGRSRLSLGRIFGRPELHVVGIVPNLSGNQAPDAPKDVVFVTYAFPPFTSSEFRFVVRTGSFDARVAESIRTALTAVLPDQPVEVPVLLSSLRARTRSRRP